MELFEILKYVIPSIVVFLTTFVLLKGYQKAEDRKTRLQYVIKNREIITPLRLQAYERIILFLERISPESLVVRVNKQGITCQELHSQLLAVIRSEFEHNLSQQLYISPKAWEYAKMAKVNTTKFINTIAAKTNPSLPSSKLSQSILEELMSTNAPTVKAIDFIKKEVRELF